MRCGREVTDFNRGWYQPAPGVVDLTDLCRHAKRGDKCATRRWIVHLHDVDSLGWSAIAAVLNDGGVPTLRGGTKWWPSTVRSVYRR
jgi:hypothetical protein